MEAMKRNPSSWSKKPFPTVDIVIEVERDDGRPGIVLIERKNPPYGWALPGGFVDYGESLEKAAVREAKEETSLDIELLKQLHTYSDPGRDPRFHTITTVYLAKAKGRPRAQDDAKNIGVFTMEDRPRPLAFDHEKILADYLVDKGSHGRRKQAKSR
jgi:8-oxo-dGTP diphosphatase